MNELTCGIVRDLLPSVADGIAGEETNAAVSRHIETCEACRERLAAMTAAPSAAAAAEETEIDFLKTAKKKHRRALVAAVLTVCLLAAAAGGAIYYLRTFVVGRAAPVQELDYAVWFEGEAQPVLVVGGSPRDFSDGVSDSAAEYADGTLSVTVQLARRSDRNPGSFLIVREQPEDLARVTLNGETIWENGFTISEETRRVFAAAHPYVGDMSANAKSAEALGIGAALGGYTNELQTSKTPYIWTMTPETELRPERERALRAKMTAYAAALLATVDNLDEVVFRYRTEGGEMRYGLDTASADRLFGYSVKQAGRTLSGLQRLTDDAAAIGEAAASRGAPRAEETTDA